jgi:hypothetical protein
MRHTTKMTSGGMTYTPSFMKIASGIQVILMLSPQQFQRLQYWYYSREGFMMYTIEMPSGGIIYIPSFINTSSGIQKLLGGGGAQQSDLISPLLYFQNKGCRLKTISSINAEGFDAHTKSVSTLELNPAHSE